MNVKSEPIFENNFESMDTIGERLSRLEAKLDQIDLIPDTIEDSFAKMHNVLSKSAQLNEITEIKSMMKAVLNGIDFAFTAIDSRLAKVEETQGQIISRLSSNYCAAKIAEKTCGSVARDIYFCVHCAKSYYMCTAHVKEFRPNQTCAVCNKKTMSRKYSQKGYPSKMSIGSSL